MFDPKSIAELRSLLGLTMRAFGQLVGVTDSTVCYWEQGKRHPSYKQMVRLNELARQQPRQQPQKA